MGPPDSELHYSSSHLGPPHCEKCGSSTFITLSPQLSELPESCQQWKLTFLWTVAFGATKKLEGTVLLVNYWSWKRSFSELQILSTVGVDIPVDYSFKSYKSCHSGSWYSCRRSFQSYQIPRTLRADVPVAIRVTKNLGGTMLLVSYRSWQRSFSKLQILLIVGVDIPVDYSFKSYKSVNSGSWYSCRRSFQSYRIPTTLRADVPVVIRATKNLEGTMFSFNCQSWQPQLWELPKFCKLKSWHSFQIFRAASKFK